MSLYKRPSGNYQASYRDPTDGKRKSRTFATKREAKAWLAEVETDIRRGEYVPPNKRTVAEAVTEWLDQTEKVGKLRPSTIADYRSDARKHVVPHLGDRKLSELSPGAIEELLVDEMVSKGLSPQTIRRAVVVLSRSLSREVRHKRINANPAREIAWDDVLPEHEPRPTPTFTETELHRLIDAAPSPEARTFIGIISGHGLRIGEALGLRRCDLGPRSVEVVQQVTRGRIGPPKTKSGKRVVPTLPAFTEHLEGARLLAAGRPSEALVFVSPTGKPRDRGTVSGVWLHRAQDAAGLPRTGWHALRRSYALMLDAAGVSPINARDLMGHRHAAETTDTYQREGDPAATFARLERAVWGDAD